MTRNDGSRVNIGELAYCIACIAGQRWIRCTQTRMEQARSRPRLMSQVQMRISTLGLKPEALTYAIHTAPVLHDVVYYTGCG